ncbi:VanW family protein [Nocardioides stalactiti]|uniref:VanW family protein n=1 Tax=Nocardioides stalactiti TaxID=2755356 RepID=UPI0016001171|nr:VanW family protein [Nocardioides stalactiti]
MDTTNLAERLRDALPDPVAERLGPAYRRARRSWQWRTCGASLALERLPEDACPRPVAEHRSVMLRALAGVDPQLQRNKVVNLRLATATLDGLVLRPGQRLSFWRHVGNPSARRGYLPGVVLVDGRLQAGVGGGLCQLTNLLHWMTLHTELTVVERWRHSYDVFPDAGRTVPFASGATCAWPSLDLQVENRTAASYRLSVGVGDTDLEGAWTSDVAPTRHYLVYEAAHLITNDAPGVHTRRNVLRRKVYDSAGRELDDELVAHNHALMRYDPVLGAGPVRIPLP